MLKIRLSRGGRKKVPFYRILVTNSTSPRDSKFLEKIGTFNPLADDGNEQKLILDKARAEHWLSVGAQPSEKVAKFLIDLGVKGAEKYKPDFNPKAKGTGLKKKAADKAAKAAEAQAAAAAEATAAAEAAKAPAVEETVAASTDTEATAS